MRISEPIREYAEAAANLEQENRLIRRRITAITKIVHEMEGRVRDLKKRSELDDVPLFRAEETKLRLSCLSGVTKRLRAALNRDRIDKKTE